MNVISKPVPSLSRKGKRTAAEKPKEKPATFYDFMPFIGDNEDGSRNFWRFERPLDYGIGCALGEGFAVIALRNSAGALLGRDKFIQSILTDMVKSGNLGGPEVGFLTAISRLVIAGHDATRGGGLK
jgi:hypothetical protein